jgi:hypothetical protein
MYGPVSILAIERHDLALGIQRRPLPILPRSSPGAVPMAVWLWIITMPVGIQPMVVRSIWVQRVGIGTILADGHLEIVEVQEVNKHDY